MKQDEELTFWLAEGMLRAGGEEVQAALLEAIREEALSGVPLDRAVAETTRHDRRPGDFGAEILAPIMLPILIEALKAFWAAFAPELQKKLMGELAGFTVERAKSLFRKVFGGPEKEQAIAKLDASIREAAARRHLDADTTKRLIALIENPKLPQALEDPAE
ncbi:hypothetical protein [Mesorhizobium sp. M1405]|uniref:hypothetical protein n=1 Tax=Mesorhizobium sp. M1405 TaxID=2957098 RepID=UPI0033361033